MDSVSLRYARVSQNVKYTLALSGRKDESVKIVGVTKALPFQVAVVAVQNGIFDLGESRVQEASEKIPAAERFLVDQNVDISKLTWHMIGRLQSNKAAKAARLFDVIHSVDSLKLARILSRASAEEGKILRVFVEVNSSNETQKGGIAMDLVTDYASKIIELENLYVEGLMTIGLKSQDEGVIRQSFISLREMNDQISQGYSKSQYGHQLSMGMSNDYPLAVSEGATMIRVGSAIFGPRP